MHVYFHMCMLYACCCIHYVLYLILFSREFIKEFYIFVINFPLVHTSLFSIYIYVLVLLNYVLFI